MILFVSGPASGLAKSRAGGIIERAVVIIEKFEILVLRAFGSLLYVIYRVALAHR